MKKCMLSLAGIGIEAEIPCDAVEIPPEYSLENKEPDISFRVTEKDVDYEKKLRIMKAEEGAECDYSPESLLNTALFRKIADALPDFSAVLFHGSAIVSGGSAFVFTAPSGTGKTTHTDLWLKSIPGSFILNGDKPILRVFPQKVMACGNIWKGKENAGTVGMYPLKAIVFIERNEKNSIEEVAFPDVIAEMLEETHRPKKAAAYLKTLDVIENIGKNTKLFRLKCNKEDEAALVSYGALSKLI